MKTILALAVFAASLSNVYADSFEDQAVREKSVWDSSNHPKHMLSKRYVSKLTSLPSEGSVDEEKVPWSDDYWARNLGGIAYRWQTHETPYSYKILSASEARRLTPEQIKKLSPAEKFDLLKGKYKFPLTKKIKKYNSPDVPGWQGICHGWSQAAIHHPQATPITLKNKHGLSIPFAASDVHALYSYYYGKVKRGGVKILGQRCGSNSESPSCTDVNAGAFHLVLANMVGLQRKSFVADVDTGSAVWNQPAYSYRTEFKEERLPSPGSAPGSVKEVKAETVFEYILENSSSWNAPSARKRSKRYSYWLELDKYNSIIGGSWISSQRPDFIWKETKGKFRGKFSVLKKLL